MILLALIINTRLSLTFLFISLVYLRCRIYLAIDRIKRTDSVGFITDFNVNVIIINCLSINFNSMLSPGGFRVNKCDRSATDRTSSFSDSITIDY